MGRQEVIVDVGGGVSYLPTETGGRPSSATLIVYKPGSTTELVSSASATVDPGNTTLAALAAAGATTLTLASGSNFEVGPAYLLRNQSGQHEWVQFSAVAANHVVTLFEPTEYAYASNDPIVGVGLSATVASAKADTINEAYRIAWTYTVDGVVYYAKTFFDVVYSKWPAVILRTDEFELRAGRAGADIMQKAGREGRDFADEITQASDDLRDDLEANDARPALFLTHDQFKRAVALRVLLNMAETDDYVPRNWKDDPGGWLSECRQNYRKAFDDALARTRTYDLSNDGLIDSAESERQHHVWLSR